MKTTPTPSKAEETTGGGGPDGKNKNEEGILGTFHSLKTAVVICRLC